MDLFPKIGLDKNKFVTHPSMHLLVTFYGSLLLIYFKLIQDSGQTLKTEGSFLRIMQKSMDLILSKRASGIFSQATTSWLLGYQLITIFIIAFNLM